MPTVDRDSITNEMTLVSEADGGQLYKIGGIDLVVLNGTYEDMGRQYGTLLKDKLLSILGVWKTRFVESGALTVDTISEAIGRPFYVAAPKTAKDMYKGIAEASGLSIEETVVLDQWAAVILLSRRAGCSSGIAWGSKTKDGTAYLGRNFDFPAFMRDMLAEYGVIMVMNPTGGQHGVMGAAPVGTITGFADMMNSAGLHVQFNNGAGTIGAVMYSNRQSTESFMRNNLMDYSKIEELEVIFNMAQSNYPYIMGVCETHRGTHFELSPDAYTSVPLWEDFSYRANQFLSPDWGIPPLPGAAGWYSNTRGGVWEAFMRGRSGDIDEKALMQIMNAPMYNDDASLTETGFTVFEPPAAQGTEGGAEGGDVTILQIIAHPVELKWWVRIPTYTGWLEIDGRKHFSAA